MPLTIHRDGRVATNEIRKRGAMMLNRNCVTSSGGEVSNRER